MRKKLYFDNTVQKGIEMYVKIVDGKIREFEGANLVNSLITGKSVTYELFKTKTDFTLEKLPKYDRKEFNIKANYKINSNYLFSKILKDTYIKLNPIEKLIIDYSKKESILHKMNFSQKILGLIFISIPLLYIGSLVRSCENQNQKNNFDQSKKNDLITKSQDTIIAIKNADTISSQTIKLGLDSLPAK